MEIDDILKNTQKVLIFKHNKNYKSNMYGLQWNVMFCAE